MPPANIAALTTAINGLTAAITAQPAVDLTPVVTEVGRVADAMIASNAQVATVIGADVNGDPRVRTEPLAP